MFYIEGKCTLDSNQVDFFQHVLSSDFPWFFQREKNYDESIFYVLGHTLMHRNSNKEAVEGTINSPYYNTCINIFKNFCSQHNIEVNTIFRASFNCTFSSKFEKTRIHIDHDFEHKNFILYVNEFTLGETCIFDNDHNLIKQIEPELHKAVVFSGEPHSHNFCDTNERRIVLVITFD